MDTLASIEALQLQITEDTKELESLVTEYYADEYVGISIESFDVKRKGILSRIWEFIKRIGASVLRVFGLLGDTTQTLRGSLDSLDKSLVQLKGKSGKGAYVTIGNTANSLLVANQLPQSPGEYINHLNRLNDTIVTIVKLHLPAVRATATALSKAYASRTSDKLTLMNNIVSAAHQIRLERLIGPLQCKELSGDSRFARTRPIYKGPDLIGNRSIVMDIPYQTTSGYASDYDRARQTSETRISFTTTAGGDRLGTDASVRPASYNDLRDMITRLRKVLDSIDSYPSKGLESEVTALEKSYKALSSEMSSYSGPRNEERYLEASAAILTAFSTWVANPHTQLLTSSLATVRAMITMINAQRNNLG